MEILSRLQDRVPAKRFPVVRETIEEELDRPLGEIFASFEESPIASASLAQVHRAVLHSGETVAVKVQYPEIASLVRSDLSNLRVLFRTVGLVERDFDLMPLVDELGTHMPLELNFVNEAHNAERISRFYEDREDVHVPRVHWEYTTRRVMVSEFIEGIKISDARALRGAGIDPNAIMRTLIEAYCEQILIRGFFHADPHPGNLLVEPKGPARRRASGLRGLRAGQGAAGALPARNPRAHRRAGAGKRRAHGAGVAASWASRPGKAASRRSTTSRRWCSRRRSGSGSRAGSTAMRRARRARTCRA